MKSPTAEVLGKIGLPVSLHELAAKTWDVIVVGAGHNGLVCAATLARVVGCINVPTLATRAPAPLSMSWATPGILG